MSGFTHALYYPHIDIPDEGWLKTAALYWDRISTIAPRNIGAPYATADAQALQASDVLTPLWVDPNLDEVLFASREFAAYVETPQGAAALRGPRGAADEGSTVGRRPPHRRARVHSLKMGDELRRQLIGSGRVRERQEWLELHRDAADCYMTILAGELAHSRGLALLADTCIFEPLAGMVHRGAMAHLDPSASSRLGQAVLAHMALRVCGVAVDTPVEEILRFREEHSAELGRFRAAIGELAGQLSDDVPSLEALQQGVRDAYLNRVTPAVDELRASLRSHSIGTVITALTAGGATTMPIAFASGFLGTPGSYGATIALVAEAAVSVIAYAVMYRLDRADLLRSSPYSYVLAAEAAFG